MSNYLKSFTIKGKNMLFPTFFPDATRGVIRSLGSEDLVGARVEGLIVNTYHLMSQPGDQVFKELGGIKAFMGWDGWIISDSGGFQVLSLIYKRSLSANPDKNIDFGTITDEGVKFKKGSKGNNEKHDFTPEASIKMQFSLGADILICLDDVPSMDASREEVEISVKRTIEWAKRCREEFERQLEKRKLRNGQRPILLAVIQGNTFKDLREKCTQGLIKIGFDGYAFGGWPMKKDGSFNREILEYIASLMPDNKPRYALGVGDPQALVDCVKMGYNIFDCVLPTRDARHQRLYVFTKDPSKTDFLKEKDNFEFKYATKFKYSDEKSPISQFCDCLTCQNYPLAYVSHLFKIGEPLAYRLSTIHNLRVYTRLIEELRKHVS